MNSPASPTRGTPPSWRWQFALFVLVVGAIVWLGALNVRAILAGNLLKLGTLEFENRLTQDAEREVYRLIAMTSVLVIGAYIAVLISSVLFLVLSPFRMKEHGWLMISAILFYLFVPVEIFTMWLDGKIIYAEFFTVADTGIFRELLLARIGALAGAPIIAQLCYYTIVALAVFQPFKRRGIPS